MKETSRRRGSVPQSITASSGESTIPTKPRSKSTQRKQQQFVVASATTALEVDAYENPTELFQWINYGNYQGATQRVLEYPSEAKTWIVSRQTSSSSSSNKRNKGLKWRYLPLHLVCLKASKLQDAMVLEPLLRALLLTYPQAAKVRDHEGHLALHLYVSGVCNASVPLLKQLIETNPYCVQARDGKGRLPLDLISSSFKNGNITKEQMLQFLSILRVSNAGSKTADTAGDLREAPPAMNVSFSYDEEWHPSQTAGAFRARSSGSGEAHSSSKLRKSSMSKSDSGTIRLSHSRSSGGSRSASARQRSKSRTRSRSRQARGRSRSKRRNSEDDNDDDDEEEHLYQQILSPIKRKASKASTSAASTLSPELQLEHALTERDMLRSTVTKLQSKTSKQEGALHQLNKEVTQTVTKSKEKIKRKKEEVEDLRTLLLERDAQIRMLEEALVINEKKANEALKAKEEEMREALKAQQREMEEAFLSTKTQEGQEGIQEAVEEATQALMEELEEKDDEYKQRIVEILESTEAAAESDRKDRLEMQRTIQTLQSELTLLRKTAGSPPTPKMMHSTSPRVPDSSSTPLFTSFNADRSNEARLLSRISSLERQLLDTLSVRPDGTIPKRERSSDIRKVEEEKKALEGKNAALEGQVLALKERCARLQSDESLLSDTQRKLQLLEEELSKVRNNYSQCVTELENAKSESLISESKLQTKVAMLERELLDSTAEQESQQRAAQEKETERKHVEEKKSMQAMNATLQDHVNALKEKCSSLEASLAEEKEKNKDLIDEVTSLRVSGLESKEKSNVIGERQEELKTEFQKMVSYVEELKAKSSKRLSNREANAALVKELRATVEELKQERQKLKERNAQLETEIAETKTRLTLTSSNMESVEELQSQAESYRQQLHDLKEKFETVKMNNSNLRDIIAKNNSTFLSKVETLTKDLSEMKQENQALQQHIHDLDTENQGLREMVVQATADQDQGSNHLHHENMRRIAELKSRLHQIAAYLMAVSALYQHHHEDVADQSDFFVMQQESSREDDGAFGTGSKRPEPPIHELSDVVQQENALLNEAHEDDREDMLHSTVQFELELRDGFRERSPELIRQMNEQQKQLRAIGVDLQQVGAATSSAVPARE